MTDASAPYAATDLAPADDWARPLFEQQISLLSRLAQAGVEIAETLRDQAIEPEPSAPSPRTAVAYAHVARAVRLTLMLQTRVIKDLQSGAARLAREADQAHAYKVQARRDKIEEIIEHIADQDGRDIEQADRLVREASDRLDEEDFTDLLDRPVSEVVAVICQDLGLRADWTALANEPWALREISKGHPWPPDIIHRSSRRRPGPRAASSDDDPYSQDQEDDGHSNAQSPGSRPSPG